MIPNVLAKLGADVLSVNPYASTRQALSFDRFEHAARVAELVRASGAQLGAVIDSDGEHLTLVADDGHVLSDTEGLMAVLRLVLAQELGNSPTVVLPVAIGREVEAMCADAGAVLLWSKLSTAHVMEVATLVQALALLAGTGTRLSAVVAELPKVRIVHETVATPWDQKGLVMRTILEYSAGRDVVLVDGVKVLYDDGWALVLPDPDEPITDLWAEGPSDSEARSRAEEYARRIRSLVRS